MILSFGDKATEDLFHGNLSKSALRIPQTIRKVAGRKLDMIHSAGALQDLVSPPANHLEKLRGSDWAGKYSIRINQQYRIVFKFENGHAAEVQIVDYH